MECGPAPQAEVEGRAVAIGTTIRVAWGMTAFAATTEYLFVRIRVNPDNPHQMIEERPREEIWSRDSWSLWRVKGGTMRRLVNGKYLRRTGSVCHGVESG